MHVSRLLIFPLFLIVSISNGQVQNVLIVGNSLSYSNSMPNIIETIGEVDGIKLKIECLCKPNYALIDHWDDGQLQQLIANKKFDFIVLQQGPSSQEWGREVLIEYGLKIKKLAESASSQLAFYMVWPSVQYYFTFPGVIDNYSAAAKISDSMLLPVGVVWEDYIASTNNYEIYSGDRFHPSKKGSFLAAMVIYMNLYDRNNLEYHSEYNKWVDEETFSNYSSIAGK